ncbi:photosystem I reaction center subunit VIII [Nostoc sp. B(2019)]|nr:photosystem I reaction center subunit VIII [Nostoc sp. B(2019)]
MAASFLPSILLPIIGWIVPGVVFAFLFLYMESDDISDIS